jgi:hypothetical protein
VQYFGVRGLHVLFQHDGDLVPTCILAIYRGHHDSLVGAIILGYNAYAYRSAALSSPQSLRMLSHKSRIIKSIRLLVNAP